MRTVESNSKWRFRLGQARYDEWSENRCCRKWMTEVSRSGHSLVDAISAANVSPNRVAAANYPMVDSMESAEELIELYGRALVRDVPYSDGESHDKFRGELPGSSKGEFVSWFLTEPYVRGHVAVNRDYAVWPQEDYLQSVDEYHSVVEGGQPHDPSTMTTGAIKTPRDGAAYVFRDDGLEQYLGVDTLLATFGVGPNPTIAPWLAGERNDNFWGLSDLRSIRGELIKEVGDMAKSLKVHYSRLRPQELAYLYEVQRSGIDSQLDRTFDLVINHERTISMMGKNNGTALLSQVYPAGAPLEASYPSVHSMLAWANHAISCIYWNQDAGVLTGNTVRDESEKLTDNIGLWRLDAGVNYRSDHYLCADIGTEIAERLVEQRVKWFGAEMEFSYRRFDGSVVTFKSG